MLSWKWIRVIDVDPLSSVFKKREGMKKTIISVLVITLSAFYAIIPLFLYVESAGSGDILYHISWANQVSGSIKEGSLYPRWLSESNNGYGSPTMIFYSPLFYLVTGLINLFIPSLILSIKVTTFAGFLLSGLSMYLFLRNLCGHAASVAGGIAYQLLPYHTLALLWRGTLAETFAFAWLPLILHFAYNMASKDRLLYWMGLAFSYAGLILTHLVTAYIFTFVIAASALFLSVRERNYKVLLKSILAFILGLSLSSVYFLPMIFERRFVHIEWLTEAPFCNYRHNFLFLNRGNSFYIALELIVMLQALSVIIPLVLIYYRGKRYGNFNDSHQFLFFSMVFAFSLYISTPLSAPIWAHIPGLNVIQFPWRWLILSNLAAAVLIGLTFNTFSLADIKRDRFIRVFMSVFHALLISNLCLASIYMIESKPIQKKDLEQILRESEDVIEYRPIWLTEKKKDLSRESEKPVIFKKGQGAVEIVSWKSHSRLFKVNAQVPSIMRVATFYYPGWTALINGGEIPVDIENGSGAILLNLPPGESMVLLEFRDTPLRKGAKWISILLFLTALSALVVESKSSWKSYMMLDKTIC